MSFTGLSRVLLSSSGGDDHGDDGSSSCGYDPYAALVDGAGHDDAHDSHDAFDHIYHTMAFVAILWFAGKAAMKLGMPALVGEIVFGIILGPHLINLPGDEGSDFLIVIGEIGLVMLVVEAGIDVDIGMLKLIGPRGLAIALLGSIFPMSMGFCISYLTMGTDVMTSIAIGACFAPTSMGIALNVLKKAKLLNTPTGQLIIAAAILDDVLALIILSELSAMGDPTVVGILMPLIVSPVLIVIIGYLALRWIPHWIKLIMTKVADEYRENVILGILFATTFAFIPMCHYLGSSHLLGAFLAGLCFCTDHTIHHVWHHQIKRVLQWMLRIFFSATIGFAIPIKEFTSAAVLIRGFVYCIAGIGKVVQGFFSQPLNAKEFFIVGFSMSAWGEFAFILATVSYSEGTIDKESFSAVLLAVLLSVIYSPYGLSFTISYFEKQAQKKMNERLSEFEDTNVHPLYFAINSKAKGQWGHQDKILKTIFDLNLEIIDFRSWHAPEYNHSHDQPLTKQSFYVQDLSVCLPPTRHLDAKEKESLLARVQAIRTELAQTLGDGAVISIKRWLPGVTKTDDTLDAADNYTKSMFGGDFKPKLAKRKTAEYCRTAAFKQAHSIMSVMQRKATLEDLKRVSSKRLPGLSELDRQTSLKMLAEAGANNESSMTRPANDEKPFGALPITDGTINISDHLAQRADDESCTHMSYIYGDEDSQHHKLPDYSISHRTPKLVPAQGTPNFEPKMPRLAEEDGDEVDGGDDAMDTDEDFDDVDDPDEAVEVDGLKGSTAGGMATLSINVVPAGTPKMHSVASHSPVGDDDDEVVGRL